MSGPHSRPMLRLVNTEGSPRATPLSRRNAREQSAAADRVARENAASSDLAPADARWVLAVRAAQSLEGGRAAVLPPQRRQQLVRLGTRLGLRPFDANLVIAIVQDGARSGETPGGSPLGPGPGVAERLVLVRPPEPRATPGGAMIATLACTLALAALLMLAMVRWLAG